VASLALLLAASAPAAAQSFSVGGGGGAIADQGTNVPDNGLSNFGGYGFFEVSLETYGARNDVLLQARGQFVTLPGGAADAPDVHLSSGLVIVTYRFREAWWEAGLLAGVGVFGVSPVAPETGQVAADTAQTVFGWCVGAQAVFRIDRRFDIRLEASWNVPQTQLDHKFFFLTAGVGYRF
jgi:hypothetical protein